MRIEVIDYALRQQKGYGLVIIDGIRDLMLDINNAGESVEVINRMMEWSSRYDLHIHCVLHLNKGDNNVRGHIGTEMSNKAETVLVISKSNENPGISEVHALHIREKSSSRLHLPSMKQDCPSLRKYTRLASPEAQGKNGVYGTEHRTAPRSSLCRIRGKPIRGFDNLLQSLMVSYEAIGFKRGRSVMIN